MAEYCPHCHEFSAAMMAAEGERIAAQAEVDRLTEALRLANEDAAKWRTDARRFRTALGTADCTSTSCKEEYCYDCPVLEAIREHDKIDPPALHAARLAEGKQ